MGEHPSDRNGGDELLDKLDKLLNRHRPAENGKSVPTLEAPVTAARDDIPVLTDAVSGPALPRGPAEPALQPEAAIENRLSAAMARELNRLQLEMPQRSQQLAVLSATLGAAIRLLVRRYVGEKPGDDAPADDREPHL